MPKVTQSTPRILKFGQHGLPILGRLPTRVPVYVRVPGQIHVVRGVGRPCLDLCAATHDVEGVNERRGVTAVSTFGSARPSSPQSDAVGDPRDGVLGGLVALETLPTVAWRCHSSWPWSRRSRTASLSPQIVQDVAENLKILRRVPHPVGDLKPLVGHHRVVSTASCSSTTYRRGSHLLPPQHGLTNDHCRVRRLLLDLRRIGVRRSPSVAASVDRVHRIRLGRAAEITHSSVCLCLPDHRGRCDPGTNRHHPGEGGADGMTTQTFNPFTASATKEPEC
jgi:hypothetical protein